jgi:3-oxoacyl-(acyl-carrier-protein) synthase
MKAKRRVAITGVGLVTPVGNDVETTWSALLAGKSGGAQITLFDASGFATTIAAEVKGFENRLVDDRKLLKFTNRSHRFALEAAEQALIDAGHPPHGAGRPSLGMRGRRRHDDGGLRRSRADAPACREQRRDRHRPPVDRRSANDPLVFCRGQAAEGLALLTRRHGIQGYATSVHTACASGGRRSARA